MGQPCGRSGDYAEIFESTNNDEEPGHERKDTPGEFPEGADANASSRDARDRERAG